MAGYGDDDGFAAWLTTNGHTLPDGALSASVLRQRGSAYVDGLYGPRARGVPTGGYAQELAWPRTGATAYGSAIPDDAIPNAWVEASYAAAYQEATQPGSLSVVVTPAQQIKRRKVGSIEREFFEAKGGALEAATPLLSAIEGLVAAYIAPAEGAALGLWALGAD